MRVKVNNICNHTKIKIYSTQLGYYTITCLGCGQILLDDLTWIQLAVYITRNKFKFVEVQDYVINYVIYEKRGE